MPDDPVRVHEIRGYQADCERCGWHTREYRNKPLVEGMAARHRNGCREDEDAGN